MKLLGSVILVVFVLPMAATADTVELASMRLAQKLYPELSDANSLFYSVYDAETARLRRDNPTYFANPEWPLILARSLVPEHVCLKFKVFQTVADGALVDAYIGRFGKVATEVDWAAPSLLDGHRRSDIVARPGVIWGHNKVRVFVLGLKDYSEEQSGEVVVYPAGDYNYSTVAGVAMRVPRFAATASLAISALRGQQ